MTSVLPATDYRTGFMTQDEEVRADGLPVAGELPGWLAGTLVRVTPALLDPGGTPVRHWFDGLAMLNAFTVGAGSVSYGSRFLETRAYREAREHGKVMAQGFATDPCRSLFSRISSMFSPSATDNCNVNVTRLGERWIAMTESPVPVEFHPATLETRGPVRWAKGLGGQIGTAHPHQDFRRGEFVSHVIRMSARNSYRLFAVSDGSLKRRLVADVPVRNPSYMHSFALTDRYAVLIEQPLVVNPLRLALSAESFIESYRWKPQLGTRFAVIDRQDGTLRARVQAEPFFTFHQVNAFEEDGEVVVDLVAYDDPSIIDQLYLDRLRHEEPSTDLGRLRRFRLPLDGGDARAEDLSDERMELPRIAYRSRNGRPYRFVYAVGRRDATYLNQLVKVDVGDGSSHGWREEGCFPGEPVFVARPGAESEDDGVILSVVLDGAADRSFLLVLDARDLGELARVEAPQRIPFGFHGQFAGEA